MPTVADIRTADWIRPKESGTDVARFCTEAPGPGRNSTAGAAGQYLCTPEAESRSPLAPSSHLPRGIYRQLERPSGRAVVADLGQISTSVEPFLVYDV